MMPMIRLKKYLFTQSMALVCLAVLTATAQPENRWDWAEMPQEQIDFLDKFMPPFLEVRKTRGDEAALKELDRICKLAEEECGGTHYLKRAIWFEAQAYSGKEDEDWGLTLYEYLYNKDIANNPSRKGSPLLYPNEYILCGNIIEYCTDLGKAAGAHEYCLKIEDSLMADRRFDLSGESYPDKGPIFSFLDNAHDREYPIFYHDLHQTDNNQDQRDFIYYPNIYALTYVAENALRSGDWVKAAELSDWCIRYTDEYMKGENIMRGEVGRVAGYGSSKRLADLALFHGYPDEATRFLREFIVKAEGYYGTGEWDILLAKLDLAVIRIQTGELTQEDLVLVDEAEKQTAGNWWNSRTIVMMGTLNKARIYHALGHKQEAWEIVDGLLEKTADDVNPYHWVQMLNAAIHLALADGATRPELEEWLVLALDNARQTGNKFEELPLYEKYARFLTMHGRYIEAACIQQEAVRLSKAMNLPKRLEDNMAALADINQKFESRSVVQIEDTNAVPQNTRVETETNAAPEALVAMPPNKELPIGGTGTSELIPVDIQPRLGLSASLQGKAAYGRFYVYNPSFIAQKGKLCLIGPIDQAQWLNKQWLTVSSSPIFKKVELTREIQLQAGASCIIDITGLPLENGQGASVRCQWTPENRQQAGIAGSWSYQTAETKKRTAVIDAHELQSNPFYLIPIHHMVQRVDADKQQIVDFAVEASSPMRIESYDATTGRLLAVDANGDGDFLDSGDLVVSDGNRDSWPDLVFKENQKQSSLVMFVKPCNPTNDDTELTIRIRTNGKWQTDAVDTIKPCRSAEQ